MEALATRYSGSFRPPGASEPLPRARHFEIWNEPNLGAFLSPQVSGGRRVGVTARRDGAGRPPGDQAREPARDRDRGRRRAAGSTRRHRHGGTGVGAPHRGEPRAVRRLLPSTSTRPRRRCRGRAPSRRGGPSTSCSRPSTPCPGAAGRRSTWWDPTAATRSRRPRQPRPQQAACSARSWGCRRTGAGAGADLVQPAGQPKLARRAAHRRRPRKPSRAVFARLTRAAAADPRPAGAPARHPQPPPAADQPAHLAGRGAAPGAA